MNNDTQAPIPNYTPQTFDVSDIESAKRIILTEDDESTEKRWARETPYLGEKLATLLPLSPGSLIVDFGCGIGRMAKELLQRIPEILIMGVDFSSSMRALANVYVESPHFATVPSEFADHWARHGGRADAVISIWVLQHCIPLDVEVDRIASFLKPGGLFVLVNMHKRAIPTDLGWINDEVSVTQSVLRYFHQIGQWSLDPAHIPQSVVDDADIRLYQRS